jgi:hypothetical protein
MTKLGGGVAKSWTPEYIETLASGCQHEQLLYLLFDWK